MSSKYLVFPPIQQVIHDVNSGLLLTNGKVYFYRDSARTEHKPVYQLTGSPGAYEYAPLPQPLRLSGIGSYVDENGNNIVPYMNPYTEEDVVDLYYIRVYSEDDVFQFDVEAWPGADVVPGGLESGFQSSGNLITNPQFVEVTFHEEPDGWHTYQVAGSQTVLDIAPGWQLVCSGTGSISVRQVEISDSGMPLSAPFALEISPSGLSMMYLRQRFYQSPRLFYMNNTCVSAVGRYMNGGTTEVDIKIVPSSGDSYLVDGARELDNSAYRVIGGTVFLGGDPNIEAPPDGYTDVVFQFQPNAHIQITSVCATTVETPQDIDLFGQQSVGNQVDHTYHVDKPGLFYKPATGFLTGWDFPLNPAQFGGDAHALLANASSGNGGYIWDQTICGKAGSTYNISRSGTTMGMMFAASGVNSSFMVMQYIPPDEIINAVTNSLSVHVKLGTFGADIVMRVYLFRAPSSASYPAIPFSIAGDGAGAIPGTLSADGVFTINHPGWTEIKRINQGEAIAGVGNTPIHANGYGFTGWRITDSGEINDTNKMAIVVTFATKADTDWVSLQSINLLPGDIPCIPSPQSSEQAYLDCASFYEKSYQPQAYPGTTYQQGQRCVPGVVKWSYNLGVTSQCFWPGHDVRLVRKWRQPQKSNIYLYSPLSTNTTQSYVAVGRSQGTTPVGMSWSIPALNIGNIRSGLYGTSLVYIFDISRSSFSLLPSWHAPLAEGNVNFVIAYHYIVDCRLAVTHTT